MPPSKKADEVDKPADVDAIKIHISADTTPQAEVPSRSSRVAPTDFILQDIVETDVVQQDAFLSEVKRIGWTGFAGYEKQRAMSFCVARQSPADVHDGNNLTRYVNCLRRYINSRNEVLVLDFIPNHEQKSSIPVVQESGEACLINEIRIALNGVLARQVRGSIYELHATNTTLGQMDVMTGHIIRKGDKPGDPWHNDFAPTIKLGRIEPGSELHILTIYMKPGRVFMNELHVVDGNEVIIPSDHTCFLHNGFVKYEQPDMLDLVHHKQLRDPMTCAPGVIKLGLYPQPFADPRELVNRALKQLSSDFGEILAHVQKAITYLGEADTNVYAFDNVAITVDRESGELISRIFGFDVSLGIVIASNAHYISPELCTHNTSHLDHQTKKEVVIRITAPDCLNLYARAIELAIARTESIGRQLAISA